MQHRLRFGPYTFDPSSGRLERGGVTVALQPQPARVLAALLSRPGAIVTRMDLRKDVWGESWVNFDQGLNYCIRQIRIALSDDARNPTYVQTLPQRGYRFVAPVAAVTAPVPGARPRVARWVAAAAIAVTIGLALGLETANRVIVEVGSSAESRALAAHLSPSHVVRGAWMHHVRPLLISSSASAATR